MDIRAVKQLGYKYALMRNGKVIGMANDERTLRLSRKFKPATDTIICLADEKKQ